MGAGTHTPGKLAAIALKKLGDGWHADGGNLYLFVRGDSRGWVFRFTAPDGKRRNMGLGSLANVSLADARKTAEALRSQTKHPTAASDPLAERQVARAQQRLEIAKRMTFSQAAVAFLSAKSHEWKNAKHALQWETTLTTYAYPVFGNLPVASVDTGLVMKCLEPIWTEKNETASRLRGRIESVLDWATVREHRKGENPARWRGHLDHLLAKPSKVQKVEHHAALAFTEIGAFMVELRAREGMSPRALEFAILTSSRSGEVRGATWAEIDLKGAVWTIPAARMKAEKEHRVPLSLASLALLNGLPRLEGTDLVFPNGKGTLLSDMTLGAVLKRMGVGVTAHGFRSTFRDWAGETTAYPREVIEHALAHQLKDKAEASYARGTLFDKRRRLMTEWANYCDAVHDADAKVVPIRALGEEKTAPGRA
jgi:integrase